MKYLDIATAETSSELETTSYQRSINANVTWQDFDTAVVVISPADQQP